MLPLSSALGRNRSCRPRVPLRNFMREVCARITTVSWMQSLPAGLPMGLNSSLDHLFCQLFDIPAPEQQFTAFACHHSRITGICRRHRDCPGGHRLDQDNSKTFPKGCRGYEQVGATSKRTRLRVTRAVQKFDTITKFITNGMIGRAAKLKDIQIVSEYLLQVRAPKRY